MGHNSGIDLDNPAVQEAFDRFTRNYERRQKFYGWMQYIGQHALRCIQVCWRKAKAVFNYVAPQVLIYTILTALFFAGFRYADSRTAVGTYTFQAEDIIVGIENIGVYDQGKGYVPETVELAIQFGDPALVKEWLQDREYVVADGHLPYKYHEGKGRTVDRIRSYNGYSDHLTVEGKLPIFRELRVSPKGEITVTLDPKYPIPKEFDWSFHDRVKDVAELGTVLFHKRWRSHKK